MNELEPLFVQVLYTEPIQVDPTGCKDVADFIEKVKMEVSPLLDEFSLAKLTLHLYTGTKLRPGLEISKLPKQSGFSKDHNSPLLLRCTDDALHVIKKPKTSHPSEERKRRWEELNRILIQAKIDADENSDETDLKESFEYSLLKRRIIPLYKNSIHLYSQTVKAIPQKTLELLHKHLAMLTRRSSSLITSNDSQRLHFIAPILVYVSDLFGPEDFVQIVIEEDLKGDNVKANGHFEFMIKRNQKRLCLVTAKKHDMTLGMVKDLVGMEVASDLNGLDTVYGIVTNYVQWMFLKSHNDKIEMDEDVLHREHGIPTLDSLKRIAGKIYAMLSDE